MAVQAEPAQQHEFRPYIPPHVSLPELTIRAILLGAVLGIIFGAASVYLALRVGITTSASIPIAVMSITILKVLGKSSILENNIVQTVGSAGESIAAAVVFSVPALIFLGYPLDPKIVLLIALTGGILGVLMMIPLRRYLIVKEHGNLRFPEGTACAEILKAGEVGGTSAAKIFKGMGIGALFKALPTMFGFWKFSPGRDLPFYRGSTIAMDAAPELMGVGYIIGYRTSLIMVAGGLLSSFVLGPILVFAGQNSSSPIYPGTILFPEMGFGDVWRSYIRYIGAGAVATGGVLGLIRAMPAIWDSLSASFKQLTGEGLRGGDRQSMSRTERDTPLSVVLFGSLGLVVFIWLYPTFRMNLLGAFLIVIFGFLFSVVSARITGIVGSSSSPLSGMTIAVLMATCFLFLGFDMKGREYTYLALIIGAVICVAISNAGTTAQDLKTGYLVGATPRAQQLGLLIGVIASASVVGYTMLLLNESQTKEIPLAKSFTPPAIAMKQAEEIKARDGKTYLFVKVTDVEGIEPGNYLVDKNTGQAIKRRVDGIGGRELAAPQANLMSVLISGLLEQKLPWDLILIGVSIALFIELMGEHSLTFAVGVYLPISSTLPIYVGGVIRKIADRVYKRTPDDVEEAEGTLMSSGLIAGGALVGVLVAFLHFAPGMQFDDDNTGLPMTLAIGYKYLRAIYDMDLVAVAAFALLGYFLFRGAAPRKGSADVPSTKS
jgi:putative OPT family oligopeptide transporter